MTLSNELQADVAYVMSMLKLELGNKLIAQGHATSKTQSNLIKSIDYTIEASAFLIVAEMYMNDYYIFLEKGVKASRIPYGRKSGAKTSKYIQGLIRFFRLRVGLSDRAAKQAAFATANKHKREGMPTRASFRFSKDGTRLGFVDSTLKKFEDEIGELLEERSGGTVEKEFIKILQNVSQYF